ncbi:MAG TPA: hypothetical protein VEJ84_15760, partial [Acidimicrobiales bacterium]|nr:hypothetical protein [Acidimicrobiales bacterium]
MTAPSSGNPGGSSGLLAVTKPALLVTGIIVVVAALVAVGALLATEGTGRHNGSVPGGPNGAAAQSNLLLDVTMVPPNGATDQSPATV